MKPRLPFHYAWMVVAAGAVISATTAGLRLAFGVFLDPLYDMFGWSRSAASLANFIMFLTMAVGALGVGRLSDRFGTRRVLFGSLALFAVGMFLMAGVDTLWELYLYYGVLFGLASSGFVAPLHATVTRWFDKQLGVAVGVVVAAQALGPVVMAPALRYLVATYGWRNTFYLVTLLAPVIFGAIWMVRNYPSDVGLRPVGFTPSGAKDVDLSPGVSSQADAALLREARRTKPFRILPVVHWLGCVGHNLPLVHVVSMATLAGVSGVRAAGILGLAFAASIVSRMGMAVLADRIGGRTSLAITLSLQALGVLILLPAVHVHALYYVFAAVFGIGFGGEMTSFPVLNREYFHERVIGSVYGVQMFGAGFGMAVGGQVGGILYDLTGGYTSAIWFSFAASAIGMAAILRLPRRIGDRRPAQVEAA